MALTERQRRFVEHYVALGNGAAAARAAGYKDGPGIYETASELLRKPEIREEIDARQANLANELGITHQKILTRLDLRAETAEKDSDRNKADELLGRYHGMWVDRQQVDGTMAVQYYTLELGATLGEGDETVDDEADG